MTILRIFLAVVVALPGLAVSATADAPPVPRLAVVSNADAADVAALVLTELSTDPSVALVERDELTKIGDEAKLQQLADGNAVALGKMAGADGLIFLDKRSDGLHVRLTAVNLGYALLDEAEPDGMDPTQEAKAIAHLALADAAKLKLARATAIPISILNLRFDFPASRSETIERNLTLLLESRLAAIPEFVVLERRHAWNLGFEHSLAVGGAPLLEGAFVLDGTLHAAGPGSDGISAQLRLRDPVAKQEKSLAVSGKADDLPGLAEEMTKQILRAVGKKASTSAWAPQAEAREYLREGLWAWEHEQPQAALEALDSAELLGETAPDLLAARIQALCQLAVPGLNPSFMQFIDDPNVMSIVFQHANPNQAYAPQLPLADRLEFARRAMTDFAVYSDPAGLRSYHLQFLDPKWQHAVQLGYMGPIVIHAASCVLAELDKTNDPEAQPLREQVRQLAGFDPLNGKIPVDVGDGAFFADEWAHSLEEEKAYYTQVLLAPGAENQSKAVFLKDRFINEGCAIFCPRFIADPGAQQQALTQFAQNLEKTPEGKLGALLILSGSRDPTMSETSYAAFLDELGKQKVDLLASDELSAHCLAAYALHARNDSPQIKAAAHAVPILRYFLTTSDKWGTRTLDVLWVPSGFSPAEAPAIWKEFQAYKARLLGPGGQLAGYAFQENAFFGTMESDYSRAFPTSVQAPRNPLPVTRFWQPAKGSGDSFFSIRDCRTTGNILAVDGTNMDRKPKIFMLHPPDFRSQPIETPDGAYPCELCLTPSAIFFSGRTHKGNDQSASAVQDWHLYRYDLGRGVWDRGDISPGFSVPWALNNQLYVTFEGENGEHAAIAKYDWPTRTATLLASDRRRPAQNQFDDRRGYQVHGLFAGLGNTIGANIENQCFIVDEKPGNWSELIPGYAAERSYPVGNRTLLQDYQDNVCVLIDPAKPKPEILFATLGQPLPASLASLGPPRWQIDRTTLLKVYDAEKAFHGGAFFALIHHETVPLHYELLWFDGSHHEPLHIPLQFKLDPGTWSLIKSLSGRAINASDASDPALDSFPMGMVTADSGICFYHPSYGVWFLPYEDVDAYLKNL